ncbi:uncharacterized protein LOC134532364 [Bacillus rossius redtenbacheri]|uniref:uncharacterized protein LOC134532364 n=1 Tax=Bacillus rossius redtenbacheri TaxID=93214 RepID=UPI002FDE09D8
MYGGGSGGGSGGGVRADGKLLQHQMAVHAQHQQQPGVLLGDEMSPDHYLPPQSPLQLPSAVLLSRHISNVPPLEPVAARHVATDDLTSVITSTTDAADGRRN